MSHKVHIYNDATHTVDEPTIAWRERTAQTALQRLGIDGTTPGSMPALEVAQRAATALQVAPLLIDGPDDDLALLLRFEWAAYAGPQGRIHWSAPQH